MILSIRTKLSLAFAAVGVILILLIGILGNALLEDHFKQYIKQKQDERNKEIATLISQEYIEKDKWNVSTIENIGINALEQGLIVKIVDSSNKVVWDATQHNNGMCQQMITHMKENMMSKYPNWQGEFTINKYPMTVAFTQVGIVEIGYYGPFFLKDADLHFITALNTALLWATLFALAFSIFIGALFSKRISMPITKTINTAKMIEKGNYSYRSDEKSSTKEIMELTATINNLAQTMENQETL